MEVYYINHKNQKIDLGRSPYQLQIGDLFDSSNKYDGSCFRISRVYKEITTISTCVTIDAPSEKEFYAAVDQFFEITETDTAAGVQGRLYIGDMYLKCNVISSSKSFWKETFRGMENTIKLLVPYPYWCREISKSFLKIGSGAVLRSEDIYLQYPVAYPYRYTMPQNAGFISNDHYTDCDFKMIIYGPCTDPAIRINGHLYEVKATLYVGEYILIDSRENTVVRYLIDGRTQNLFNQRNKESNLFQKIPSGRCAVLWNAAAFGFDLTLFQERSEPAWNLS